MNINIVAHNLLAMNAERMTGINTGNKAKSLEKLSSGYRVNRAADDAAGLAISEGMRRMIRGLNQGTANAKDGISWLKIGDGSLNEAHEILHRMTELTVKSLNETYTDDDRALMQVEFEHLQSEIDRLTDATRFNEKNIFADHEFPYYQLEGNKQWQQDEKHVVTDGANNLIIDYQIDDDSPVEHAEITVAAGEYTTQELVDEIDTALEEAGLKEKGLVLEYTRTGYCNMNIEGGISLEGVSGGLEYLIHDMYGGGSAGSLIGTTTFPSATSTVSIYKGVNDELTFDIVSLDGTTKTLELTGADAIPEGTYTRADLINYLNEKTILKDTSVKAVEYGTCIKLESDDSIITRLKGNMFKVDYADKNEQVATSVFYDNIGYSEATPYAAHLKGAAVLTTDNTDMEHQYFHIDSSNNKLIVQPNESSSPITLTIADGEYTAERMSETLNQMFKDNGLDSELKANYYYDAQTRRKGLTITSLKEGLESKIGIDPKSSAYKTLFTTRAYNQLEIKETYTRETTADRIAYFLGGKDFSPLVDGSTKNLPLTVVAGQNDKFMLNIDGVKCTVTLNAGQYDNISDLTDAIKDAIDAAADGLGDEKQKEKFKSVDVTLASNRIYLTSDHKDVVSLQASAIAGNKGFGDLFTTTTNYKHETATSKNGVATLNTPVLFPATLKSGVNTFKVTLDGSTFDVTIPAGTYDTEEKLLEEINKALPQAKTEQLNKPFKTDIKYGSYNSYDSGEYGGTSGIVSSSTVNYKSVGTSDSTQGGGTDGKPLQNDAANVTFYFSNNWPLTLDSTNNELNITINGKKDKVTLAAKKYNSIDDIKTELQTKLNNKFGSGFGGVTVTKSGSNGLKLTANLMKNGVEQDAKFTNIECSTTTSSFLKKVNTTEQKASLTIGLDLQDSFTIGSSNNNFSFQYYTNGAWKPITVSIPNGTTRANLAAKLNATTGFKNNGITADIVGNRLVLTANTAKNGDRLRFNSNDCRPTTGTNKSCVEAIFKNVDKALKAPPALTLDEDLGEGTNRTIKITSGKQKFTVYANGKTASFDLAVGTYNLSTSSGRTKLQDAINKGLSDNGLSAVTATIDATTYKLTLKNSATGTSAYTQMIYDGSADSAMPSLFGTKPWTHQGIKAEFDADKKLKLTAVDKDGKTKTGSTISVMSQYGSIFQTAQPSGTSTVSASWRTGYHSKTHASINGAPLLGNSVEITDWNNTLNLYYYAPLPGGSSTSIYRQNLSIKLQNDTYDFDGLAKELQEKLDEKAAGVFKAEVSSKGVKISMVNAGNRYYFDQTSNSGGFYYNVLRRAPEKKEMLKEQVKDGGYDVTVYAMGRQNVRNGKDITKGVNDELTMDFTYGTNTQTFSMTLTPGHYSGAGLVQELQSKLNEELKKAGLAENLIQVEIGVGGITLPKDLIGYNNDSLTFKLADNVEMPTKDKVTYKIDGIGGNAAFSIFYQTDGDMRVAYAKGSKDVKKGVVVPKDCEFSLDVDGNTHTIKVDKGDYTAKEITEYLAQAFKDKGVNVTAKIEDGNLQIVSTKYGKHPIKNITGEARRYLFFEENGRREGEEGIRIRLSGVDGDSITIERPVVNTVSLGINSIAISKTKYANKALSHIKDATIAVSGIRMMFGTMQNRLEHKVNSNDNAAENTQAAESVIRDTDIAKEMLSLSKSQILEQVSQSMLAQANQQHDMVLSLLQ